MIEFINPKVHQDFINLGLHGKKLGMICNIEDLSTRLVGFSQRSALQMLIFCPQVRIQSGKKPNTNFIIFSERNKDNKFSPYPILIISEEHSGVSRRIWCYGFPLGQDCGLNLFIYTGLDRLISLHFSSFH